MWPVDADTCAMRMQTPIANASLTYEVEGERVMTYL